MTLERLAHRLSDGELIGILVVLIQPLGHKIIAVHIEAHGRQDVAADELELLRVVGEEVVAVGLAQHQQLHFAVDVGAEVEAVEDAEEVWDLADDCRRVGGVVVHHALHLVVAHHRAGAAVHKTQLSPHVPLLEDGLAGHEEDDAQLGEERV